MNPHSHAPLLPDVAGSYAERIREHMKKNPDQSFTVPELVESLKCGERRVREGIDRLVFLAQITAEFRLEPGKAGRPPLAFKLISVPAQA